MPNSRDEEEHPTSDAIPDGESALQPPVTPEPTERGEAAKNGNQAEAPEPDLGFEAEAAKAFPESAQVPLPSDAANPVGDGVSGDGTPHDAQSPAPDDMSPAPDTQGGVEAPADLVDSESTSDHVATAAEAPALDSDTNEDDGENSHTGHAPVEAGESDAAAKPVAPPVGRSWFGSGRSQLLAAVLLAGLGFALVVQVGANQGDEYSTLRQSELVRLLDEATQRTNELEARSRELEATRDELAQGVESDRRADELAQEQAVTEGILSGRLPATGPGIELTIIEGSEPLSASVMFNILEELRNAGAEVVELNGVRVVTSTWFTRGKEGLIIDGQLLESPYHWTAIGEPTTLEPALEIAGGAMSAVRNAGAQETIRQADELEVTATREPAEPEFATPVPETSGE